ncbi:hypothetical protein [Reichenbachiella sp.]|uniref:hypothetical protein n=1 Tax=Reichenbachiella sp. TaxID=2184521 RepID=UPI003BB0D729
MKIQVGKDQISYSVEGDKFIDKPYCLLDKDIDLSKQADWNNAGYVVKNLFDENKYHEFHSHIESLLRKKMVEGGLPIDQTPLSLYHTLIKDYQDHLNVVDKTKLIDWPELGEYFDKLETKVSEICGTSVQSKKPMNGERVFHFRVIRPNQADFNPLHKDAWQEENCSCINLYIPICGSNEKSSLILAKGSHLFAEDTFIRTKEGARMNNVKFNVPGLISSKKELNFVRPNPSLNQILVFSPYLIHGGSINLNTDQTRISLEMRFWKKD